MLWEIIFTCIGALLTGILCLIVMGFFLGVMPDEHNFERHIEITLVVIFGLFAVVSFAAAIGVPVYKLLF